MSFRPVNIPPSQARARDSNNNNDTSSRESLGPSNADSQPTDLSSHSTESRSVFTPINGPIAKNSTTGSGQGSSQESQLLQLSQLAAARDKIPDLTSRSSMKRTADGALKDSETSPSASPGPQAGHSRNASGVSAISTASSRVTELSSELKTRLHYAMVKINNGWQSRTIDEVENLASRSGSPASSNSTIPGVTRSSASPQISHRPTPLSMNPASRPSNPPSLAPPVSIQPDHTEINARRNSIPQYTPAFLAPRSPLDGPHTPGLAPVNAPRMAADAMVVSPAPDNREKDAMEALLFMSSPGNSANMKHHFPNAALSISNLRKGGLTVPGVQRTALPTSAPKRKSLPNGRPTPSSQPVPAAHSPKKRVGFGKSPSSLSEMDVDDPTSPRRPATFARPSAPAARKPNGKTGGDKKHAMAPPSGRRRGHRPRPRVSLENLDEVLDRVAAETSSSESEGEIELGPRMRA